MPNIAKFWLTFTHHSFMGKFHVSFIYWIWHIYENILWTYSFRGRSNIPLHSKASAIRKVVRICVYSFENQWALVSLQILGRTKLNLNKLHISTRWRLQKTCQNGWRGNEMCEISNFHIQPILFRKYTAVIFGCFWRPYFAVLAVCTTHEHSYFHCWNLSRRP